VRGKARDAPFAGHALCNALKLVEMPLDQTVRSVSAEFGLEANGDTTGSISVDCAAFGICEGVNFAIEAVVTLDQQANVDESAKPTAEGPVAQRDPGRWRIGNRRTQENSDTPRNSGAKRFRTVRFHPAKYWGTERGM